MNNKIKILIPFIILMIFLVSNTLAQYCTDSDNGQNFDVKGEVIDKTNRTEADYCTSSFQLVEWYCNPDGYANYIYSTCTCENGRCLPSEPNKCSDGTPYSQCSAIKPKYCDNGNLINNCQLCGCPSGQTCEANGNCTSPPSGIVCTDSSILGDANNDGKVTYEDYIIVFNIYTGAIQPPSNICCVDLNKDGTVTREDSQLTYDIYVGKINLGRCNQPGYALVAQNCTDSDNGKTYDIKGTIKITYTDGSTRTETDSCNRDGTLREWFCGSADEPGGLLRSENYVTCPAGKTCSNGACSETISQTCNDGTPYSQCSAIKPKYCDNGNLINNCQLCGCPSGQTCEANGNCTSLPSIAICTDHSILGDANNDGKVTYEDYIIVFNIYTGAIQPPSNICCVDLNKDGEITREDSQLTYDVYVGKINLGRCNMLGCVVGDPCTTSENCPGKYDIDCNCIDIPNDNCPTIVNDTNPPVISNVSITPEVGPAGTIFTIKAKVEDESALQYVATIIYILNNDENSVRLEMYDDGQHNDEQANDGVYGALWDSAGYGVGMYGFYIPVRDVYNNDASTIGYYFLIGEITDKCKEVIPGHNNIDEPRANIVFVGINYPDKEFFKTIVEESVDFEGNKQGLLFLEPLKSNKDMFNFWYVDETRYLGHNHWDDLSASNDERIRLSFMCPMSNKYVIAFYDTFFRPQAFYKDHAEISFLDIDCSFRQYCNNVDLDNDGCISGQDYLNYLTNSNYLNNFNGASVPDANGDGEINGDDLQISFLCQQYRVGCSNEYTDCLRRDIFDDYKTYTPHEFGHLFGGLLDEYVEEGVAPYSISYNGNCFEGTKNACLSNSNDKWYDFLGYGCGDNDKIDCAKEPNCQYDANEDGRVTISDRDVVYNMYTGQIPMKNCTLDGQEYIIGDVDNDGVVSHEDYIAVNNVGSLGVVCDDTNDPGCYLEVGCFEGCNYQATGWFRNTVSNIMRNNFVSPEYFSYGPVNERVLCQEIKSVTGSAIGICDTKYNIR